MTPAPRISIVIPLWNEAANVEALVRMLGASRTIAEWGGEAVLVENGSADATREIIRTAVSAHGWINPLYLPENLNYGGGLLAGAAHARGAMLCFVPGDLQYLADDIDAVVSKLLAHDAEGRRVLLKGNRTKRLDPGNMQFVSSVYTGIANFVLGLHVKDVNGLPKAFHRSLLDHLPKERMATFVLDAQLIHVARKIGWPVEEVAVTFHARRAGVSSWSGKRIKTYLRSIRQLWRVRIAGAEKIR